MNSPTPHYGHTPIKMQRVRDYDAVKKVGDFYWGVGEVNEDGLMYLSFAVPRPTENNTDGWLFQMLPVKVGQNETGKHWGWDGNEDLPTLVPSIHAIGHWHGFVRAGVLIEA
jgi:hypothetical protein